MRRLQNRNPIARNLPLFIHLFFWMSICADPAGAGTAPIPEGIAVPSLEASQASKTNPADLSWLCVSVILHEELTAMKLDSTQNKLREQAILAFLNEWNRAILQTSRDSSQFSSRTFLGEYLKLQRTQNKPSELSVFQNFYMQEIKPNSRLAISRIIHQEGFVRWSDRVKLILQASTLYLAINEDFTNAAIQIGQILSRLDFNQQNKAKIHQYFEGLAHAPMTRESARFTGTDSLIPGALGLKLFSASKVGHLIGQQFEKIVQYLNQSQNLNLARASLITSTATATTGVLNYQELEAKKRLTSMTHPLPHRNLKSMSSELQYPSLEELVLDASDLLAAPIVTPAIRKMRANRLVDFVLLAEAEVAAQRFHWSSSTKERFLMAAYESIENVSAKVRNIIERKRRSNQDITFEDIFYIRGAIFPMLSGNNLENPLSILSALGTTVPDDLKGVAPKFGTNQIGHTLLVAAILAPYFGNDSNWKLGVQFYANGLHPVLVPKTFPFNNPQAWDLIRGSWVPEKYMIDVYSPDAFIVNFLYQLRNWHESQSSRTATMNALRKLKRDDFLIQLGMQKMEGYNCNGVCYPLGKSFLDRFGPLMSHLFSSDIKLPVGETYQEILPPKATEAEESIPDSTQNSETMSVAQYALAKIFSAIYKTNPPSRKQFQTNAEYETRRAVLKLSPWETASGFRLENESVVQIEEITNEKNENAFPWAESQWKLEYILSGPNIGHNGMVSTKTIEVLLSSFGKIQTSPLWLKWKKSNFDLDQMITSQTSEGEHILRTLKTLRTLTVLHRRAPCPTTSFCATLLRQFESTGFLADFLEFERKTQAQLKVLTSPINLQVWIRQMESLSDETLMSRLHWLFWINEISKYQNDLIPQDERAQAFTETWSSQNFAIGSPISVQNEAVESLQDSISKELAKLQDPSPRKLTANSRVFQVALMNKANQTNGNAKVPKSAQQHIPLKLIQVSDRVYGYIFSAGYIRDSAPTILFGHFEEARKLLTATRIQRLKSQNMFNVYSITHSSSLLFLRDEFEQKKSKAGNQIRK